MNDSVLNTSFTSYPTYPSLGSSVLNFSENNSTLAAVVGHPVEHSLSPAIFQFLAKTFRIPLNYQKLNIPPQELEVFLEIQKANSRFLGANITLPHKQAVIPYLDEVSSEAQMINAVNVLHFKNGRICGYNTDIIGVEETLRTERLEFQSCKALIFGAGGAALAAAYTFGKNLASEVWIANRTFRRAIEICTRFSEIFEKTQFRAIKLEKLSAFDRPMDVYLNATPVGMENYRFTQTNDTTAAFQTTLTLPFPRSVKPGSLAFDLVYQPLFTPFLETARTHKMKTVTGLEMLIWQALATWELWFGSIPEKHSVKISLHSHLKGILT